MKSKGDKSGGKIFCTAIFILGIAMGIGIAAAGCSKVAVPVNRLKIQVNEEGVYRIHADALASTGMGIAGIDPERVQLSMRGSEQSLFVFQDEDGIWFEFIGQKSESLYSIDNYYILEILDHVSEFTELVNSDERDISPTVEQTASVYYESQHIEENLLYYPQVDGPEHWFWAAATVGQRQTFSFLISELLQGEGHIQLDLWSNTEAQFDPDHHLQLMINDQLIIDEFWNGKGAQQLTATIPEGLLVEGENLVVLEIPGDTQAEAEVSWINWFEVSYPRRTIAQAEQLKFTGGSQPFLLSGFHDPVQFFDITDSNRTAYLHTAEASAGSLVFAGQAGHTYYAVGEGGLREPISISPMADIFIDTPEAEADYLVIGPEEFLSPADELLIHRESQGLKVLRVPLEAIYDQFSYGFPEPEGIKRFLMATRIWETAPKYVLLIGDASYDPRNYLHQAATNILPTNFVQTQYGGQTASDIPYADLSGDGIPDIALSRVPASSPEEVSIFVRKTLDYENNHAPQADGFRILVVADGQEAGFQFDAQRFLDNFSPDTNHVIFTPAAGVTDANHTIHGYFNEGFSFMAYFGHGSVVMWGKDQLFTAKDAEILTNTHYPIVLNMTCLTGLFTHPKTESISEALLFNPSGGAVAIFAPTSLTLPGDQSSLSSPLGEAIDAGTYRRLGDIYLFAQQQMTSESTGVREVLETFLFFGDPGLVIFQSEEAGIR